MSISTLASLVVIAAYTLFLLRRINATFAKKHPEFLLIISTRTGILSTLTRKKMKKISTSVLYFIASLLALTPELVAAAIDGTATLISSDPNVLLIENLDDGTFKVHVAGPGECQLIASGDADLGDGVQTISTSFAFTVFDQPALPDHFELTTSGFIYRDTAPAETAAAAESAQ